MVNFLRCSQTVQMNQLDHLIVFLTGPDDIESLFPESGDLILDPGTRHVGQGTRNRRVIFDDCYVELVWVDSPVEARASGLHFEDRCMGAACPFGVVFRGRDPDVPGFVQYTVPDGPTLKIMDDPCSPFVAVYGVDHLDGKKRMRRKDHQGCLNSAHMAHAVISVARFPPDIGVSRVAFVNGSPGLSLTLAGLPGSLRLARGDGPPVNWRRW